MSANPTPKKKTVRRHVRKLVLKPGQPSAKSKLSYEIQEKIIQAIRGSQTFECAAALAGIDRTTLNDWRYRGQQEPDSRYASFNKALEQALLESEAALVKVSPVWLSMTGYSGDGSVHFTMTVNFGVLSAIGIAFPSNPDNSARVISR